MGKKHRDKKDDRRCRGRAKVGAGGPQATVRADRYLIAVHEAGHGVALVKLFGDLEQLVVTDKGTGRAKCSTTAIVRDASRAQLEAAMLVAFAGQAAEALLAKNRKGFGRGSASDLEVVRALAYAGGFSDDDVASVASAAAAFVAANAVEIEAVAKRLNRCGRLWGSTIAKIVAGAGGQAA